MSIKYFVPNTYSMYQSSFADFRTFVLAQKEDFDNEICSCILKQCDFALPIFVDPAAGNEEYRNDFTTFVFKLKSVDILNETIRIYKDNILIDETAGGYTKIYDAISKFVGIRIDWSNIYNAYGIGNYYISFSILELGITEKFVDSINYSVALFDDERAKNTVKLKWVNNGIIEDFIDFRGTNTEFEIRLYAKASYLTPTFETTEYENSLRETVKIQSLVKNNYQLTTNLIPKIVGDILVNQLTLSDYIIMTDYNFRSYSKLYKQKVLISEIVDFKGNYDTNKNGYFTFKLVDFTKNTLKRNIKI